VGTKPNSVAVQSFEWCFDRLSLAQSRQFWRDVNPRMATHCLSNLETGRRSPSFEKTVELAKALDVPVGALFSFEQDEADPKKLKRRIETNSHQGHGSTVEADLWTRTAGHGILAHQSCGPVDSRSRLRLACTRLVHRRGTGLRFRRILRL
jgi:hypothetical protein